MDQFVQLRDRMKEFEKRNAKVFVVQAEEAAHLRQWLRGRDKWDEEIPDFFEDKADKHPWLRSRGSGTVETVCPVLADRMSRLSGLRRTRTEAIDYLAWRKWKEPASGRPHRSGLAACSRSSSMQMAFSPDGSRIAWVPDFYLLICGRRTSALRIRLYSVERRPKRQLMFG
jgi:hypothetical protein